MADPVIPSPAPQLLSSLLPVASSLSLPSNGYGERSTSQFSSRRPSSSSSFGAPQSAHSVDHPLGPNSHMRRVMSDSITPSRLPSPPPPVLEKDKRDAVKLEDFELIRVVGKGCAGRVLLVRQTSTSRILAMKAISKRSVLAHKELEHTMAEVNILKRFAIHEPDNPFVSRLHHSFTDRENFYFVMDFYPGGDLATQMEIHGILGHHRTRFYAADLVQGLEDLHRHGIIVRDLKPENILLNARGHAVLADFGLSKEFSYRGEPKSLHMVTYPGQGELPQWAGKGAGSLRTTLEGTKKLVIDRAYSFVGTSEYLVVKRSEYSYAVDWWALGCIVLEGMIGRVPFRKEEEEPPIILWNKILCDPWDAIFRDPKYAKRRLSDYGLDPTTWHFIDSLLIKDPMWRLTEPYVKQHAYFQYIDWDTVRRGEYDDPHDLHIHPVSEYNTHYFPKLCLDEDPTVDMTSHDMLYSGEDHARTPLNDNVLFMLEQAKFKKELEAFTWSRDLAEHEPGNRAVDGDAGEDEVEEVDEVEEMEEVDSRTEGAESEVQNEEYNAMAEEELEGEVDLPMLPPAVLISAAELEKDVSPALAGPEEQEAVPNIPDLEEVETEDPDGDPDGDHDNHPSSPRSLISISPSTKNTIGDVEEVAQIPPSSPQYSQHASDPAVPPPTPSAKDQAQAIPIEVGQPIHHNKTAHAHSSPRPIPTPTSPKRPKVVRNLSQELQLDLPTGLPASGLSVSDLISVPSPSLDSPGRSRIVRRHRAVPSVDSIPISRLSVELHGTITHLGDDDWEQLDMEEGMGSMPNGNGHSYGHGMAGPSSFFNRVLRKRPSTLQSSGLRRQTQPSDTSSRSSESPNSARQGQKTPGTPGLFAAAKSLGGKKALEKIKAFPKLRKVSQSVEKTPPPSSYVSPSASRERDENGENGIPADDAPTYDTSPPRPIAIRRHTESGWFEKKRLRKQRSFVEDLSNSTTTTTTSISARSLSTTNTKMSRSASTDVVGATASMARRNRTQSGGESAFALGDLMGSAPRLELTKTPPIVWDV